MAVFWRLFLAHLLADFPLQSKWFIVNKNKSSTILIHSGVHLLAGLIATYDLLLDAPGIILAVIAISGLHFITDFAKSTSSKKGGNVLALFITDQLIHVSIILTITAIFFLESFPLESLLYFRLSLAVFTIWTLPVFVMLCEKGGDVHGSTYLDEESRNLRTAERGLIFVGIAGGIHLYPLILGAILARWILTNRGHSFPVLTWSLASVIAIIANIWRLEWFKLI